MYCDKCGDENRNSALFCSKCGNSLINQTESKINSNSDSSFNMIIMKTALLKQSIQLTDDMLELKVKNKIDKIPLDKIISIHLDRKSSMTDVWDQATTGSQLVFLLFTLFFLPIFIFIIAILCLMRVNVLTIETLGARLSIYGKIGELEKLIEEIEKRKR